MLAIETHLAFMCIFMLYYCWSYFSLQVLCQLLYVYSYAVGLLFLVLLFFVTGLVPAAVCVGLLFLALLLFATGLVPVAVCVHFCCRPTIAGLAYYFWSCYYSLQVLSQLLYVYSYASLNICVVTSRTNIT